MLAPLFAPAALPAPLDAYDPATALPDFAARVTALRQWQQRIASGYVTSQKEEALQAEFLTLVFGRGLGYEFERAEYRQLLLEKKTAVDGTKPDGALGEFAADAKGALGGPTRAVVELKDARTSLDAKQKLGAKGRAETPVEQAFSYPSKMGASCRWVIVSNFVELRLYAANDQTRAEVFDFRTLPDQPDPLRRFFALLGARQLLPAPGQTDAPLDQALQRRLDAEATISKAFYRDYRAARRALLDHLLEQNPTVAPLTLLGHTQKLLDRVIFVCFCEDKNIIPRLTFRRLLDAVRANVFDPADDKIYRTVRGLFRSIDEGNPAANINRFNGGLFAPDAALDALVIKDRTLGPVLSLERYDFASDLNVNILGHIFEQSLADLEAERARLLGQAPPDAKQGKRKQDGIFYTPDYITRYIVAQAVGGWLRERRQEAGLDALPDLTDADRQSIRYDLRTKRLAPPSARVQQHIGAWEQYGQRLRAVRVLDPACGSGAFLNEAFGYLLREGEAVNAALAELRAGYFDVFDLDRHILQHNLYGVDLNPESVQITRLSLWLQTANPGRPLTTLDHSIRCGNSLIADPAVAGDRAFDWQETFPEVFADGGFDVVVGNPPYGAAFSKQEKAYLTSDYPNSGTDTYVMFWELALKLTRPGGMIGHITPNTFLVTEGGQKIRQHLFEQATYIVLMEAFDVFSDAVVETIVAIIQKGRKGNYGFQSVLTTRGKEPFHEKLSNATILNFSTEDLAKRESFIFNYRERENERALYQKMQNQPLKLGAISKITAGTKPYEVGKGMPPQSREIVTKKPFTSFTKQDETWHPVVRGGDINRFVLKWSGEFIKYGIQLAAPRKAENFFEDKIFIRRTDDKLLATYDRDQFVGINSVHCLKLTDSKEWSYSFVTALLNSKALNWFFQHENFHMVGKPLAEVKVVFVERLPIPNLSPADQQPFIDLADELLAGHRALHEADARFAALLRAELGLTAPLTGKLALGQPWQPWSTALQKALGRPLTLTEKADWLPHFAQHQQQQAARRTHLADLDRQLDARVYALYQLTAAEIALVEAG